ncbi:hypothetical protein BOX15_Mlig014890g1 [Macrostomum lignano]|uniref:Uncharacterized protein n=1 Tax=Macrostomum lignano TaxID=282301 RepID=A0A267DCZ4_9PLAT|nr:hypothetical protein BOX15_Mlig005836g2 [Macrostomum lignano]PAA51528.1 hypothetical protein BOX15_Mlig005836g1 [Macrostomum lignano]PAA78411.1 hypothetical protein BOX15_Mlig005836g3 [Macrostomum lignano]PAA90411.1 hypothetical protein BOX15_Mlig014890g1 [Macrostomum lignano]
MLWQRSGGSAKLVLCLLILLIGLHTTYCCARDTLNFLGGYKKVAKGHNPMYSPVDGRLMGYH